MGPLHSDTCRYGFAKTICIYMCTYAVGLLVVIPEPGEVQIFLTSSISIPAFSFALVDEVKSPISILNITGGLALNTFGTVSIGPSDAEVRYFVFCEYTCSVFNYHTVYSRIRNIYIQK